MKHAYVVLTQTFCEQYKGYTVGANSFNYAITVNGLYVASSNSVNEFPELFEGMMPLGQLFLGVDEIVSVSDEALTIDQIVDAAIKKAVIKGEEVFSNIRRENVKLGIESYSLNENIAIPTVLAPEGSTSATDAVLMRAGHIMNALRSGSTKAAIRFCKAFPEDQKDDRFLTSARLLSIINELEDFHGLPRTESL
jgi:hypothetical protein